jgi:integral membrane protein
MLHSKEYMWLRWSGWAEGLSFLLLLGIAMPLKYLAGQPEAVRVVGSAHGALFVIYIVVVLIAARRFSWPLSRVAMAFAAAFFPFGPFWFDARLRRELNPGA